MKGRPILFSAPMVRAILKGGKTQTRRVVKPPKYLENLDKVVKLTPSIGAWQKMDVAGGHIGSIQCPYGQPGDRLWVRETWMESHSGEEINGHGQPLYRASWGNTPEGQRWKPSIHMPRWASRINLEITSVRVERLQDITEADARAEGVGPLRSDGRMENGLPAYDGYADLWESINGAGSWDANPWVWVVEFKRVEA